MKVSIETQVYLDHYRNVCLLSNEEGLESIFQALHKKGTVLNLTLTFNEIGSIEFCQAEGSYDKCNHRFNPDGTCPNVSNHKVVTETPSDEDYGKAQLEEMVESA